jgi:predicted metal-dependent hydrolase
VNAALLDRAVEEWERGAYYDAHETLEDFLEEIEDDDELAIAVAVVQIAASLHKLVNDVGASAVPGKLERALAAIEDAPARWNGIDLAALREDVRALLADLTQHRTPRALPVLRR